MEWVAYTSSFAQLKALSIRLTRDDLEAEQPNYISNAIILSEHSNLLKSFQYLVRWNLRFWGLFLTNTGKVWKNWLFAHGSKNVHRITIKLGPMYQ